MPEHRSSGFTFLELTVALAIVSLVALAALRLQQQSFRAMERTQLVTQAVLLAQEKMTEAVLVSGGQSGQGRTGGDGAPELFWEVTVAPSTHDGVNAVRVRVRAAASEDPILEVVNFVPAKKKEG